MEELPLQPNKPATEAELTPADPEKIGDLLLRYELPASEPVNVAKVPAEQSPKLLISRDKLRDRIGRYKELKLEHTKESAPEEKPAEQLTEVHFERRHEVRDETPAPQDQADIPQEALPNSMPITPQANTSQSPPPLPPPMMPATTKFGQKHQSLYIPYKVFKKPLLLGLAGGILASLALILFLILR
jgi:hypothetical protein